MNEQITAIAALLLEINGKEKYTAFFDFSGHVRTFSIRIYSGKWSQGKAPYDRHKQLIKYLSK